MNESPDLETWRRDLLEYRGQKDLDFAKDPDSPLSDAEKGGFRGLVYFDPDPTYRVVARLVRIEKPQTITMDTTKPDRQMSRMKIGYLEFTLGGEKLMLYALQGTDQGSPISVPFTDATTGAETYHDGRYVELEVGSDDECTLDFNYAYSPYCAYNDRYACLLPPPENRLRVAIRAGEKKFH